MADGQRENGAGYGDELFHDKLRSIPDNSVSKDRLAAKPVQYVLKDSQRQLSIGYDLAAGHLTLSHEGIDAEKLPPVAKDLQIYQSKIVDTSTSDTR